MRFSSLLVGVLATVASAVPLLEERQTTTYTDYLFVYFVGEHLSNGEQIYMSVSNNNNPGSWTQVNGGRPVLTSTVGTRGVRDPSVIRSQDGSGKTWIIATDLWVHPRGWNVGDDYTSNGSKAIVVWETSDMRTWSGPFLRNVSPSNAGMTWAPDAIWDPASRRYLVHWTCHLKGEGWFIMRSFTSDFVTFTPAERWLTGAGMDATVAHDPSTNTFYRISKNGPGELIEQARASALNGPWTVIRNRIGEPLPAGEGPLVFRNNQNPNRWHLLIDDYTRGRGYQPFETTNIGAASWTQSSMTLPPSSRHGYVVGMNCVLGLATCDSGGTPPPTTPPPTTPPPTTPPPPPSGSCSSMWGQCGGQGYSGPTCCSQGTCQVQNPWYSQCI
ncbi:endo-1,4-beta-xylanase [Sodiomyces alkalinus F11]|uniref:Endo-1,4-beta-xylanase n=1 Tax=Sodiomyces alkalinus (strain CBS 110278 / VKM F-3762 / F11) TaxID=1314773 RepID=A0A3N2Q6I4_SODAK|nr:endo-1,4-beta-xylanase [Sodiomyces alkalinus F11]ROT42399.1 endo-1,4-beta-xylanase [Sodiomyces alkalinus F11]